MIMRQCVQMKQQMFVCRCITQEQETMEIVNLCKQTHHALVES